jgi:hypothetical protein
MNTHVPFSTRRKTVALKLESVDEWIRCDKIRRLIRFADPLLWATTQRAAHEAVFLKYNYCVVRVLFHGPMPS